MTREEAQAARGRRRDRIVRIRRTVAALSLTLFIAMFSTIYVQMAAGRDPILSTQAAAKSVSTGTSSGDQSAASSASGDTSSEDSTAASSDTGAATDQPAAVTTSQS